MAEDRDRFKELVDKIGLKQPRSGIATSFEEAHLVAAQIGYRLWCVPSLCSGRESDENNL